MHPGQVAKWGGGVHVYVMLFGFLFVRACLYLCECGFRFHIKRKGR